MIYASEITKYDCTIAELEERLLFWIAVAGKNAETQSQKLQQFLTALCTGPATKHMSPFQLIRRELRVSGSLRPVMKAVGLGKYDLMERAYTKVATAAYDLRTVSVETLMTVPGIGPKTARCFVLHSRAGARLAGLDRHVMRFLKREGYTAKENTPGSPTEYAHLEKCFLIEADKRGMTPADFDLMLWKIGAGRI